MTLVEEVTAKVDRYFRAFAALANYGEQPDPESVTAKAMDEWHTNRQPLLDVAADAIKAVTADRAALFYFQSLTAVASGASTDDAPALSAKGGEAAT